MKPTFRLRLVFVVLLISACNAREPSPAPPRQRDLRAELTATPAGLEKLNPAPAAWMLGCYSVVPPATKVLQLTGDVHSDGDGIRQYYRVRVVREGRLTRFLALAT